MLLRRFGRPATSCLVKRVYPIALALVALAALALPGVASAGSPKGVQHLHFRYGPLSIRPGSNLILIGQAKPTEKPSEDGYVTRIKPNLITTSGAIPPTYKLHLHHGVWLNTGAQDATIPGLPERFFASGEEKTTFTIPAPYGYPVKASDHWIINYMIHDLTNHPYRVYLTYDVDFVPLHSKLGRQMKPVKPVWMDVENGHTYPVFDVLRGSGTNGKYTFPDQAIDPYGNGPALNQWTLPYDATLVATAGHIHPGGLYDDLMAVRSGTAVTARKGGPVPGDLPDSVRLFRSYARYFGHRAPTSWDMAMTATPKNWRVRLRKGDVLRTTTTYDSRLGSWYESMGIMVAYVAVNSTKGVDPFTHALPLRGHVTHGHLNENNVHGGVAPGLANPLSLPSVPVANNTVKIEEFKYQQGDLSASGARKDPAQIPFGQSPCNLSNGVSYPIADGAGGFDSGQLGFGTPGFTAFNNKQTWSTPTNLPPGTYTYFCRIHPFMRGAFRVVSQ
jgi:hypothetical protein